MASWAGAAGARREPGGTRRPARAEISRAWRRLCRPAPLTPTASCPDRASARRLAAVESPDEDEVRAAYKIISRTPPASLLGAGVKLRLLLDRDLGLEIGTGADDMISLRQLAELIERQARQEGGRCKGRKG